MLSSEWEKNVKNHQIIPNAHQISTSPHPLELRIFWGFFFGIYMFEPQL